MCRHVCLFSSFLKRTATYAGPGVFIDTVTVAWWGEYVRMEGRVEKQSARDTKINRANSALTQTASGYTAWADT